MKNKIYVKNHEELILVAESLRKKYIEGGRLQAAEIDFLCSVLQTEDSKEYPICDEHRFRMLYFRSLPYNTDPRYPKLSADEIVELQRFGYEWNDRVILVENPSSQTRRHLRKEAIKEISLMSQEFKTNGYLVKNSRYEAKLLQILYQSRYIHFKVVYEFFLGNDSEEIPISSSFGEVAFNDYSYIHILSRHYAAGVKQYSPIQSFFSEDVRISSIHRLTFLVLGWIQREGIRIPNHLKKPISFKFKNIYYRLYLGHAYKQKKGHKGNIQFLRVDTLFPVSKPEIIAEINSRKAHQVSKSLTIFNQ